MYCIKNDDVTKNFYKMLDTLNDSSNFSNIEDILTLIFNRYCSFYKTVRYVSLESCSNDEVCLSVAVLNGSNLIFDLVTNEYKLNKDDLVIKLLNLFNLIDLDLYNKDLDLYFNDKKVCINLKIVDDLHNQITFKINNKKYDFLFLNIMSNLTKDILCFFKNIVEKVERINLLCFDAVAFNAVEHSDFLSYLDLYEINEINNTYFIDRINERVYIYDDDFNLILAPKQQHFKAYVNAIMNARLYDETGEITANKVFNSSLCTAIKKDNKLIIKKSEES